VHLSDIARLPIDMNCLNSRLLKLIANKVTVDQLLKLNDKKDRLKSKLYMKKFESLIEGIEFFVCSNCNVLYTAEQ
jgi:hypothetical protein